MSQKIALLIFDATGHVLGAVTRTSQPDAVPKPVDIVGDRLLVRDPETGQLEIHVASEQLNSVLVDDADHVLLNPRAYAIESGLVEERPALPAGFSLTLDGSSLGVALGAGNPVSENTDVWVQVEGDALLNLRIQKLEIPEDDHQVSEAMTLPSGDYTVLVLIPGFRAEIREVTVP